MLRTIGNNHNLCSLNQFCQCFKHYTAHNYKETIWGFQSWSLNVGHQNEAHDGIGDHTHLRNWTHPQGQACRTLLFQLCELWDDQSCPYRVYWLFGEIGSGQDPWLGRDPSGWSEALMRTYRSESTTTISTGMGPVQTTSSLGQPRMWHGSVNWSLLVNELHVGDQSLMFQVVIILCRIKLRTFTKNLITMFKCALISVCSLKLS